ncbi:MAG: ribosome small subunit-dependent GTPase A [Desulfobacterales bacterium]|nr:ribosome small subunit-dependent GTPase A [Desulfobacterales bacterium]
MDITLQNNASPLEPFGLTPAMEREFKTLINPGISLARVTGVHKNLFTITDGNREILASATGKLYRDAENGDNFPAVGDWVALDDGFRIDLVLPRQNTLVRGAAGNRDKKAPQKSQVIAANLDTVFIVCGLDRDFNLRRIERYLTLAYTCEITPVILLSKADLHEDVGPFIFEVSSIAFGVPVHPISSTQRIGVEMLQPYLKPGQTVALVGSSGAGKSTLLNALAQETIQKTHAVSDAVGKGVHTTTAREMIRLRSGALLIDNPGIREIAFWETEGSESAFPEIDALAQGCRFSDCTHTNEPGCEVQRALSQGELDSERLESFFKQKRELSFLRNREELGASRMEKKRGKWIAGEVKKMKKMGKMQT